MPASASTPRFFIIRYPEGGAGVFLTSVLSASDSIGHFDPMIEFQKTTQTCLAYIKEKYTDNVDTWLLNEPRPQNPLNLHFISARFSRGDDLTRQQFQKLCRTDASEHFWKLVANNKYVPLIWHKQNLPNYFKNPKIVTILLDKDSYKWYHRALWYKKYGIKDNQIHVKADDPVFNPSRAEYFAKFNNPYLLQQHPFSFIKNNILRSPFKKTFAAAENFAGQGQQVFITLSEILNLRLFVKAIRRICLQLDLEPIPDSFVEDAWSHWRGCHAPFMPKYS